MSCHIIRHQLNCCVHELIDVHETPVSFKTVLVSEYRISIMHTVSSEFLKAVSSERCSKSCNPAYTTSSRDTVHKVCAIHTYSNHHIKSKTCVQRITDNFRSTLTNNPTHSATPNKPGRQRRELDELTVKPQLS